MLLFSCEQPVVVNEKIVASIGPDNFYEKDLLGYIPVNSSPEDSLKIANQVINSWLKETIYAQEATNKNADREIEEMVKSYRKSLLIHNFENKLIESELDTIIDQSELAILYKENEGNFLLTSPCYLVYQAKIPDTNFEDFEKLWKDKAWEEIDSLCGSKGFKHNLTDSIWVTEEKQEPILEEIKDIVKLERGFLFKRKIKNDYFFFQVMKIKKMGEEAPQIILNDELKKLILHKRKREILEKKKLELYNQALSNNSITLY